MVEWFNEWFNKVEIVNADTKGKVKNWFIENVINTKGVVEGFFNDQLPQEMKTLGITNPLTSAIKDLESKYSI